MAIIVKNNEAAEYPYISKCKQYDYRMHKNRVLLAHNQGSTLSADRDPTKAIVMYNFWRGHWHYSHLKATKTFQVRSHNLWTTAGYE